MGSSSPDRYLPNGLVIGAGSETGLKVDVDTPAYGFRDITGEIVTRGVGATDPAWTQIGSGPFYAYSFAINDVCWIVFHIPHDYKKGTPVFIHTHWLPDGTDTAIVKWKYDYTYARGHNQQAFDATGQSVNSEQAPPGVAYQHMVTETASISIPHMEPDGILYVKMTRLTNGAVDNADEILVLTLDVHYQSTNMATKNRSPDFYG